MINPTSILSDEHVHILKVVNALVKECDVLRAGKQLDKIFFSKAVDFIRHFAVTDHFFLLRHPLTLLKRII